MSSYRLGSHGVEVGRIQRRLRTLGYYTGPVDSLFGGHTESAVKAFQRRDRLNVDGVVGQETWKRLFGREMPDPAICRKPLAHRCLALTGSFETGLGIPDCFAALTGDFDGQGISFGALQWNFGQDSLQPLLLEAIGEFPRRVKAIFQEKYDELVQVLQGGKAELLEWARGIQHPQRHFVFEPWRGMFQSLGRVEEFQDIEARQAGDLFAAALALVGEYGLWSERAAVLMFDIKVQNGSISGSVRRKILAEFEALPVDLSPEEREVERMTIVAHRRAEAANPRWVEDVRARKLCCAQGEGTVHGIAFHLEDQFGIRLSALQHPM